MTSLAHIHLRAWELRASRRAPLPHDVSVERCDAIVRASLPSTYPVVAVRFCPASSALVASVDTAGLSEGELVEFCESVEAAYGDAAADTWMEGDIGLPSGGELSLRLDRIDFGP